MKKSNNRHIETIAVHAGRKVDPATGAVSPPIQPASTYQRDADGGYSREYEYGRYDNPNRQALETSLASLESGATAAAFASGCAAAFAVFQNLRPGDHVLATHDMYHGIIRQLKGLLARWDLKIEFIDTTDVNELRGAISNKTKLIWIETPSNPLLRITDLAAVAEVASKNKILCAVDNTFATPVLQNPLEYGFDLVMHSTTKYIGGHSDVIGGAVIAKNESEFFERVRLHQRQAGAVPSPFDCWLQLRSINTLPVRVRAQCANAKKITGFLAAHNKVSRVRYPGLNDHPGHDIASRQMRDFGGVVSFEVAGGEQAAMQVAAKVELFQRATSLGGVESLIEHRASIEGPETLTPRNLLRLSIGIEHSDDLIADLDQALS